MKSRDLLQGQLQAARYLQEFEMDLRTWEVLTVIALNEGEGMAALADQYKIPRSAFSRQVLFLCGERTTRANRPDSNVHKAPLRFVERRNHPSDSRRQDLFITAEGEGFLEKIRGFTAQKR